VRGWWAVQTPKSVWQDDVWGGEGLGYCEGQGLHVLQSLLPTLCLFPAFGISTL
jgi:hypothetical protein